MNCHYHTASPDCGAHLPVWRSRAKKHRERARQRDRRFGATHPEAIIPPPPGLDRAEPGGGIPDEDMPIIVFHSGVTISTEYSILTVEQPILALIPRPNIILSDGVMMIEDGSLTLGALASPTTPSAAELLRRAQAMAETTAHPSRELEPTLAAQTQSDISAAAPVQVASYSNTPMDDLEHDNSAISPSSLATLIVETLFCLGHDYDTVAQGGLFAEEGQILSDVVEGLWNAIPDYFDDFTIEDMKQLQDYIIEVLNAEAMAHFSAVR